MKNLIIVLSAVILFTCIGIAQERGRHNSEAMKKIEELEKIKLIDALGLNEDLTLRFFARRNEYKKEQSKLIHTASGILDQMDDIVQKDTNGSSQEYKRLIDQYLQTESKIEQNRMDFINSLSDILTYQQISKLLIFEKKFREEIRAVLFKERAKWRK